jgi:phage-related protein
MAIPTISLSPSWGVSEEFSDVVNNVTLGDGYDLTGPASIHPNTSTWSISRTGLTKAEVDDLVDQLSSFAGVTSFYWSPLPGEIPRRLFYCDSWTATPLGLNAYEFVTKFTEDVRGECSSYASLVDEADISSQINQASAFITAFTGASGNYLIRSSNNLIVRSLHSHSEQIPDSAGTLYDQVVLALACLNAYELTSSSIWLTRATDYTQAIVDAYYNSASGAGTAYLPHWLRDIKADLRLEDIYPTARTLNTGEVNTPLAHLPTLWELYDRLYTITEDTQWQTLATSTKADTIAAATFSNQSYVYRKNSGSATEYPGTQFVGTASRVSGGALNNYGRATGSSTLMVENINVETAIAANTTYTVEASSSVSNQVIEFFVSTSTSDVSETQIYRQFWRLGTAGNVNSRTFASHELFRWDSLAWYYGIGLVSGTANYEENSIEYNDETFDNVVLRLEAGAQLTINVSSNNPFKIFCKVTDGAAIYRLQDANGFFWDYSLAIADWTLLSPAWGDFTWSPINTTTQSGRTPSQSGNIQGLRFVTSDTLYIWWVGAAEPTPLPLPSIAYRAGVRDRSSGSRSLSVGDVYPTNTTSDALTYSPGAVPFARNIVAGVPGNLTGLPYSAYQNVLGLVEWNEPTRLANVINFLKAAQADYSAKTGDFGPFSPVYTWNDVNNLSQGGTVGQFGFNGFDNYELSGQYQAQIGLWLARAWYEDRSNADLRILAMSWLNWLDQVYATRENTLPPNEFPADDVAIPGHNPGVQALIGEAALWCNLAGGDTGVTFRWIVRSITYLSSQLIEAGYPMSGSWSLNQSTFATTLKNYYSWWHGAVINFYSLLLIHKPEITYPSCSEPLTIALSSPIPEACCGSPVSPCGVYLTWNDGSSPPYYPLSAPIQNCRVDVHLSLVQQSSGPVFRLFFGNSSTSWVGLTSDREINLGGA